MLRGSMMMATLQDAVRPTWSLPPLPVINNSKSAGFMSVTRLRRVADQGRESNLLHLLLKTQSLPVRRSAATGRGTTDQKLPA